MSTQTVVSRALVVCLLLEFAPLLQAQSYPNRDRKSTRLNSSH